MSSKHSDPLQKTPVGKASRTWGETYLANYNVISAFAWFNIPLRLLQIYKVMGPGHFHETAEFVRYVQTLAVFELVHSATGLVRAPIMTTVLQVFSRIFIVWGIVPLFPNSIRGSYAYPIMLLAWSVTEVIRYSFYAWNVLDEVPYFLLWLRYSTFWVLYPIGVGAELWTMTRALKDAYAWQPVYAAVIVIAMLGYIPGFYSLFTHMIRQRKKVLGKASEEKHTVKKA